MCGKDATDLFNSQHSGNQGYLSTYVTYIGTFSGTAPSAGSGSSGFCFSEISTVQVEGMGPVAMKDLKVGDKILSGSGDYQPVWAFGHFDTEKSTEFLQIHTNKQQAPLEITGAHMVFLNGKSNPVRADSVKVGDALQDGSAGLSVKKISTVTRKGLYAPLTPDGTLMVDGIKASSYITLQDEAVEHVELQHGVKAMSQHFGIHLVLSPLRMLCRGVSPGVCQMYDADGMPHYVSGGIKVLQWFDSLNLPLTVQVLLLSFAFVVFGLFYVTEMAVVAGITYAPAIAFFVAGAAALAKALDIKLSPKQKTV
jgi:hypothetical protein